MGYLVKASPNADTWAYALVDDIRTDVVAGFLTPSAMVRDEKQDSWHTVGELIGTEPKGKQVADVPCMNALQRRGKSLMIIGGLYAAVSISVATIHFFMGAPTGGMSNITFIGLAIIGLGTFYQGWRQSSQLRSKTPQDRN